MLSIAIIAQCRLAADGGACEGADPQNSGANTAGNGLTKQGVDSRLKAVQEVTVVKQGILEKEVQGDPVA